jgi:hypothetical protein
LRPFPGLLRQRDTATTRSSVSCPKKEIGTVAVMQCN